jgi:hypothetical protein
MIPLPVISILAGQPSWRGRLAVFLQPVSRQSGVAIGSRRMNVVHDPAARKLQVSRTSMELVASILLTAEGDSA